MTWREVCAAALVELGVYSPVDTPSAEDLAFALGKSNRLLDNWNAERCAVYSVGFTTYTLTPNHQPHLIGPALVAPDFAATQRPVTIAGANIVVTNVTPNVRSPLSLVDSQWWLGQPVPALTSTIPTDLYYAPDWPNGSLYLWPVPTVAYGLELETRAVLAQVTLETVISLPPGYLDALTLSLAESLLGAFPRRTMAELLIPAAAKARARIFANNDVTPRIATQDAGMPRSGSRGSRFNYLTRQFTS